LPKGKFEKLTYAEFCAGIGGFRKGIAMSKHFAKCVYTNEIDEKCEQTYYDNYGETFDSRDIFSIDSSALPDFDMMCSGFPCQPFSIAGARDGFSDDRGKVIFKLLEIISIKKPSIVFFENVPNLARHKKGESLSLITKYLVNEGYDVYSKIIDSKYFGLPQSRPRLYIVAIQTHKLPSVLYTFPEETSQRKIIRDIINEGDNSIPISDRWQEYIKYYTKKISYEELSFVPPKTRKRLERIAPNCDLDDCIFQIRSSGIRAYSLDAQFPTFAVSNSGGGAMIPILTKEQRHLSLIEMKRLMGFEDDFVFTISRTDSIKQLANAVCPPVICRIFDNILEAIDNPEESEHSYKKDLFYEQLSFNGYPIRNVLTCS
jgi:DNA (cytosine-5)-methyltransferase 1